MYINRTPTSHRHCSPLACYISQSTINISYTVCNATRLHDTVINRQSDLQLSCQGCKTKAQSSLRIHSNAPHYLLVTDSSCSPLLLETNTPSCTPATEDSLYPIIFCKSTARKQQRPPINIYGSCAAQDNHTVTESCLCHVYVTVVYTADLSAISPFLSMRTISSRVLLRCSLTVV